MLQSDPQHRPSLSEVLGHPWMQGEVPSYDEVKDEFKHRYKIVVDKIEKERNKKLNVRNVVN